MFVLSICATIISNSSKTLSKLYTLISSIDTTTTVDSVKQWEKDLKKDWGVCWSCSPAAVEWLPGLENSLYSQ